MDKFEVVLLTMLEVPKSGMATLLHLCIVLSVTVETVDFV